MTESNIAVVKEDDPRDPPQEERKIAVLYHANCMDGEVAAWVCWRKFGDKAVYIPCEYGQKLQEILINAFEDTADNRSLEIYIVDFSFPAQDLLDVADFEKKIVMLDHHKGILDDLMQHKEALDKQENLEIVFDLERSGAGITWDYFNPDQDYARPMLVNLVEDRDLWRFTYGKESKALHAWWQLQGTTSNSMYNAFFDKILLQNAINEGMIILHYISQRISELEKKAWVVDFADQRVCVVNAPYFLTSELGNHLIRAFEDDCDLICVFQIEEGQVRLSFRSDDDHDDVAHFAKEHFSGGGHRNAAGGVCSLFTWGNILDVA